MQKKTIKRLVLAIIIITFLFLLINNLNVIDDNSREFRAHVLEVDDRDVRGVGISRIGVQRVRVEIKEGKFSGEVVTAANNLTGNLGWDYRFEKGDEILVAISETEDGQIASALALDVYRQGWLLILLGVFIVLLLLYAGYIGLKALFSFIASIVLIWRVLIPGLINGLNPLLFTAFILAILSALILFSIAGFTKKGLSAFFGTTCSLFITIGLTMFFGSMLALDGMSSPYVGELLAGGYMHLNVRDIFFAAVVIGSSGAAMDIAMDMATTIKELQAQRPDIEMKALIKSGFNVGSDVIGTMTTTLLLAYSGGYLTLMMAFMTRTTTYRRIFNLRIIVSEILRILVGSIGIVLVAPITTLFAAWLFTIEIDFKTIKTKLFK
ncbi:YibE/F family protein [Halanaerobium sp. Z-7514]|uniref:YibE/F family protein n=1 Tax=Halanaerobium polyolivorans TaxID=2886943 RepID=A0AAW4WU26_9FIRM|nr:YibE/F family protein [Halanaerobium polyolivorans]MCC3144597.1 YibE/F family protein [Halanaerobium polyolivorans]